MVDLQNSNLYNYHSRIQMEKQESGYEQSDEITEAEILQMLHKKKMTVIQQRFQENDKGLPIDEFVSVMLEHLDYDRNDSKLKLKLTLALIDFFKEVDVNGDQSMEWEEFSNHIIELGLLRNDRSFKNVIKNYYISDKVVDREKHQTGIENLYYFEKLKNIFLIEKQSSRFKVYNANSASLLYEVNAHKGQILDLEFLEYQNLIASSSNDLTLNFWDASSFTLKQIVSVPEIQLRIRYANWRHAHKQLLYTGGSDAIIHIYDAATLKEKGTISGWNPFYKTDAQQEGHSSPIGDILPIDAQQTLVSACLGGNICLWDSTTHQLKKQLRGHDKGVYSLAWCDWSQMNQCLLSAGLDHEAFVWNTYVKDKIFLLRGHNHPLVGVKCLPDTPQIITADTSGMVKVWDVRNFLCVQTFNAPLDELAAFSLTYSSNGSQSMKKRIICGGKKLSYFEYDEPKDQLLTDEKPCLQVIFNATLLCITTLHPDSLKVWDAKTGKLISVYRGLSSHELCSIILDNRQRKLFVGDSSGEIFTVNIRNGARMKNFQKHDMAVTGLSFWSSDKADLNDERYQDLRRIISVSMGTEVFIHDEDAPQDAKSSVRYVMKQHKKGVNSVSVKQGSQILATGSEDGNTIITNLMSYRHEVLPKSHNSQVKHVLFLDPYDCLISINANGLVTFYATGDSKFKNKIVMEKQYEAESMTKNLEPFPVTAVKFDRNYQLLLLGDEFGNIKGWSLCDFLEALVLTRVEKSILSRRRDTNPLNKTVSSFNEENLMLTQIRRNDSFNDETIEETLKITNAHTDGITSIELIEENEAFITSSFDCCCYLWSLKNSQKIGSLLLGGDIHWNLKFNMDQRNMEAKKEAEELLGRIGKSKLSYYTMEGANEQQQKQMQTMKQNVLKGARQLLQNQKRITQKNENFIDILGDTNKLEREFFEAEEEDSSFNLMAELTSIRNNILTSTKRKR